MTNSLFTCLCDTSEGLMDQVYVDMDSSDPPQGTITLCVMIYSRFNKYVFVYKIKQNSNTFEKFKE